MRKKLYIIIILALFSTHGLTAETTGQDILDRAASALSHSKSVKAIFSSDVDGVKSTGSIIIQGDKFHISSADFSTWYDGRTQWTYSPASKEVNITEPTPQELTQVNPFIIISNIRKAYNARLLKATTPGTTQVELTPKDTRYADIRKAVITFNNKTDFPLLIILDMASGVKMNINIKSITKGNILLPSTFTFDKKHFPGVEIVDLR